MKWKAAIGLGVAGNFTGHLEQAGEASDFKDLAIVDPRAPKGVFPFYIPGDGSHFLHHYPISSTKIRLGLANENHQIEPEVSLLCDLRYENRCVVDITPREAMAHNDCSIRNNELHPYGIDSAVSSYSYMYDELIAWLIDRLNHQIDEGPLEDISQWLNDAGHPSQALISIGATRHTDFGETTFLDPGDWSVVAVYDGHQWDEDAIREIARSRDASERPGLSLLSQEVV